MRPEDWSETIQKRFRMDLQVLKELAEKYNQFYEAHDLPCHIGVTITGFDRRTHKRQ